MDLLSLVGDDFGSDCFSVGGTPVLDAESSRDSFAIGRIGLHAVDDVPLLDVLCRAPDRPRGVVEQDLPLLCVHHAEKVAGLLVMVIIDAMVPMIADAVDLQRRF